MERFEICLAGHGGQGLVLAGKILAEALALYHGKQVVQTQSYGPEARGGASRSEIVVSSSPIDYPKVTKPDLLLTLNQESLNRYLPNLKEEGILVADAENTKEIPPGKFKSYSLPITQLAKAELGKTIFSNIIALGAIAAITGIIPREPLEKAVISNVPAASREMNKKALDLGFRAGEEAAKSAGRSH
ncbi:2-oxoacid:acceptor oxidoreductase family protein [Candidatus Saganbacteria bacterium]|uniref:2-oxoacid:acceptor oxidoreductase family protein n=1 Tax=Candidatus Saganbacteria bacterium TaxID=2575572 RepID=A0A9D6UNZ0_UNCSA|nr:2-oxoacid:acceptor oxidoreductase family protein [Candidatus Saganbacteria bacterium]